MTEVNSYLLIAGDGGTVYRRLLSEQPIKEYKAVAGIYDIASDTWTALPNNGVYSDLAVNNSYMISGDGSVVVGNMYIMDDDGMGRITPQSRAAVWAEGKNMCLGSRFVEKNDIKIGIY